MDILAGTAAAIVVDFETPAGTVIPNVGSVTYSLFDHTGVALVIGRPVTTTTTDTYVSIIINISENRITSPRRFETRTLTVTWAYGGAIYTTVSTYRLIPVPTYYASCHDIRTFLGLNEDELHDEEIDIFGAYLALDAKITLASYLNSGTIEEVNANDAIILTAVVKLIPSLRLRTIKESTSGSETFSRFASTPDFDALETQAKDRLAELLEALAPEGTVVVTPTLMMLSVPTDAITG